MLRGEGGTRELESGAGKHRAELDWRTQGRGAMATRKRKKKGTAGVVGHNHNSPHSKKNSKKKYEKGGPGKDIDDDDALKSSSSLFFHPILLFAIIMVFVLVGLAGFSFFSLLPTSTTTISKPLGLGLFDKAVARSGGENHLYWGTYRSTTYFGLRARTERSLVFGMMWWDPSRPQTFQNMRHQASQDHGLEGYGWERHDGETYGEQVIRDGDVTLTTSFVKSEEGARGKGGDLAVRIGVERKPDANQGVGKPGGKVAVLFYALDERIALPPTPASSPRATLRVGSGNVLATGDREEDFGGWSLRLARAGVGVDRSASCGLVRHAHNLTSFAQKEIYENYLRTGGVSTEFADLCGEPEPSLAIHQFLVPPGEHLDLVFVSGLGPGGDGHEELRASTLSGPALTALLAERREAFDSRFAERFQIGDPSAAEVSKRALSNLLGSIGHFTGNVRVRAGGKVVEYPTTSLFTCVPSRSFFPRGFLWDEGFHQLVVRRWSKRISRQITSSWFDMMNADGWIPREAILGHEALDRVPPEFVTQDPTHANPPSMLMPLRMAARGASLGDEEERDFLSSVYPSLRVWFGWFLSTQGGDREGAYRWRGRDSSTTRELNPKTLTSGLDDYPRATHPTEGERHLDLRCWVALGARTMAEIAEAVGAPEQEARDFDSLARLLEDEQGLRSLHYDEEAGSFHDYGLHAEQVALRSTTDERTGVVSKVRVVTGAAPENQLVREFGYVSLFPLMMRLLHPDSEALGATLRKLRDDQQLWSPFGLRSLSSRSRYFGARNTEHDPPYWRGAVWVNLNYLVLDALGHYAEIEGKHAGECAEMRAELRQNLLKTLVGEYNRTGYLWEQYVDGLGKGSHPFTGWTALLVLIASE